MILFITYLRWYIMPWRRGVVYFFLHSIWGLFDGNRRSTLRPCRLTSVVQCSIRLP